MKNLKEIVDIFPRRHGHAVNFGNTGFHDKRNKLRRLHDGIASGKYTTDLEANMAIYKTQEAQYNQYAKLKGRLREMLLSEIFNLKVDDTFSTYHQEKIKCNRNLAICHALAIHGARNNAIELAIKTLNKAKKYTFHEVVIGCARILKDYYTLLGESKKHHYYKSLILEHQLILQADMLAEDCYQELTIHYNKSVSSKIELTRLAVEYDAKIKPLAKKYHSFILHYYMYRVSALVYGIKGNYRDALKVYISFERYVISHPVFYQKLLIAHINYDKLDCYLHLNDIESGQKAAEICLKSYRKDSPNWFLFLEHYFLLTIRTKQYVKAKEIFNMIAYSPRIQYFSPERKEKWRIFEAYLNFILENVELEPSLLRKHRTKRFNILKFLNEVPIFSKDKRGFNIAILIIHILFMLTRKDFDVIIKRTTALEIYRNRYLKREEDIRSKLFIKMLLIMEKCSFDYKKTRLKCVPYFRQLRKAKYRYEGSATDCEVIPYEGLWRIILKELKSA